MSEPTTKAGRALLAAPWRIEGLPRPIDEYIADIEAEARNRGYRAGRLAVWDELAEHVQEQVAVADRELLLLDGPLPTADEVRGILANCEDDK